MRTLERAPEYGPEPKAVEAGMGTFESLRETASREQFPTSSSIKIKDNLALRMHTLQLKQNENNERFIALSHHFKKAQEKIKNSPALRKIFPNPDVDFVLEYLLPIIIKETMLNGDLTSSGGAYGYGQLTEIAIKDLQDKYPAACTLSVKDPADNLILSYIFHKFVVTEYVSTIIKKPEVKISFSRLHPTEFQYFVDFAYNAGIGNLENLLKQSQARDLLEFQKYCAKKIWLPYNPQPTLDPVYNVDYIDTFGWRRNGHKIHEWIRYADVVSELSNYLTTPQQIDSLGMISISPGKTLYAQVLAARGEWKTFKADANIMEICTIIARSNGFEVNATPPNTSLIVPATLLERYLHPHLLASRVVSEKPADLENSIERSIRDRLKDLGKRVLGR